MITGLKWKNQVIQQKVVKKNKLNCRPVLLAQIKARNNSQKLKTKSEKCCIFCINTIKSPKRLQQLNQAILIMGDNKLDLTKDAGINLFYHKT